MTEELYLGIGGNMENRFQYLNNALELIEQEIGKVIRKSSVYETDSWGFDASSFLNQVIQVQTTLTLNEALEKALLIEKKMGRARNNEATYNDRIIDIDILFYGAEQVQETNLTVPHPKIQERKFVLIPMNEIAPNFIHPIYLKSMADLLKECTDELKVTITQEAHNAI